MKKEQCTIPPEGWTCTRGQGHEGPCAALPKKNKPSWFWIIFWMIMILPVGIVLLIRRLW